MEQALRARSLSSASARRKRIQEREGERQKARTEARQRALALQDLSDPDSQSGSDDDTPGSSHSREDSVETSSEYSLNTPNDTPQPQAMYETTPPLGGGSKPALQVVVPETPVDGKQQDIPQSEPAPKLHASLATFSDFQYDRFSMIVDSPAELVPSPVSDSDAQESFCEVATPVSYRLPRGRPAVVSITSKSSSSKRRNSSAASSLFQQATQRAATMPPDLPARSPRRLSQSSQKSGFLASEAAPFQVPELPPNAMYMIANASRDSLAISTHSAEPSSRPHHPRKPSMPLLSAAFKSSHARMSSIKGLVSPSISGRPNSRSDRPRTAAADEMTFQTVPTNLNEPPPPSRNRISHRPSTSYASVRSGSVTALPTPPAEPRTHLPEQQMSRENSPSPEGYVPRKKSFSNLRKRSESISNTIKFISGAKKGSRDSKLPPTPTAAVPPLPSHMNMNMRKSVDLRHFPSPPPPIPSPRDQLRKSVTNANYSPFPSGYAGGSKQGMIGLGIRT